MTIGVLKKIIENIPEDFTVECDNKTTIVPLEDKIEIDVSNRRLIFK